MYHNLFFICGPTAIGKSHLALRLAKKIGGVIVNSDSMQVYSNLEILTARPSKKDLNYVPHELYGYVNGSIRYNVAKWCSDISNIIKKNKEQNIPIIIVGGTGMYIQALINGLIHLPTIPELYKKKSGELLNQIGIKDFVELVKTIDKESIKNISYNDTSRLRRIWEVYNSTGIQFSEWKKKQNIKYLKEFSYKIFLFIPNRKKIYESVNVRFNNMIKNGAIDEVKNLLTLKLDQSLPVMRAHGVPEISNYLKNNSNLNECIHKGQKVTRNYVKRQLTWWKGSNLKIHLLFDQFPSEIDENLLKINTNTN